MIRRAAMAPLRALESMRLTRLRGRQAAAMGSQPAGAGPPPLLTWMPEEEPRRCSCGQRPTVWPNLPAAADAQGALRRDLSAPILPDAAERQHHPGSAAAPPRPAMRSPGGAGGFAPNGFLRRRTRQIVGGGHATSASCHRDFSKRKPESGCHAIFVRCRETARSKNGCLKPVGQQRPRMGGPPGPASSCGCNENRLPVTNPEPG